MTSLRTTDIKTAIDKGNKKALLGAWLGFYVDLFDIYLPVIVLAPALVYFQATGVSTKEIALITGSIFAATLIGRPLGAFIFGSLSDKYGRRRITVTSITGFGLVTLLIGLLPGYKQIGILAVILLISLRFIDGVFLGGQYTSATPTALEQSPKDKRGRNGAIISTGFPLAYLSIALITLGLLHIFPAAGINSPYVQWGWRIPFFVGSGISVGFAIWYHHNVHDSEAWLKSEKVKTPLRELLKGKSGRNLLQVFVLTTGLWFTSYMLTTVLPGLMKTEAKLSPTEITLALLIASSLVIAVYLGSGLLSQRFGRRPILIVGGLLCLFIAPIPYTLIASGKVHSFGSVLLLLILVTVLISVPWGCITTYLNERFALGVRSSGYGVGYSLGMIVPAFYVYFQTGLSAFIPLQYTAVVILCVGGFLTLVGSLLSPETRDVDMSS